MTVIITTNEPKDVKELFIDRIEDPMGFDMLLYTVRFPFPIERKKIPQDLISSVQDGRLQRELIAMREVNPDFYMILLHGCFEFKKNGDLIMPGVPQKISNKIKPWTKKGIRNLLRSLSLIEGAIIEYAETDQDLVDVVNEWQTYLDNDQHRSIQSRPRLDKDWAVPKKDEQVRYWMQGLPGISSVRAKMLQKKFKTPQALFSASVEDIMSIDGFGKKISADICEFLKGH